MNAMKFSGNASIYKPGMISLVLGLLVMITITASASFVPAAEANLTGGLAKSALPADGTTNIYIPHIVKDAVPPSIPTLYDIENADGDDSYTINWSTASLATSYTLEEDDNADFSSPTVAYSGTETTKTVAGKALGNYYYRVKAENGTLSSGWSAVKMASVTTQPQLICETHNFGTVGVSLQVLPSGSFDHFTAENNMLVETVEVKASLKASQSATYVYIAVGINQEQLFHTTQYIWNLAYISYTINRNVTHELHVGDDIFFYITRSFSDPVAYIGWGNYVKLCGH